jgi:hypothetical protein
LWVVETFLRESKSRAFSSWRKRLFLRARARIPRKATSTEIEAEIQHTQQVVLYGLSRSYSLKGHKNRGRVQFSTEVVLYGFLGSVQQETGMEIEAGKSTQSVQYGFCTVHTLFYCTKIEVGFVVCSRKFWHSFLRQAIQH